MRLEANLAARPFRNERLSWLAAIAVAAALAAATLLHARALAGVVDGEEAASTETVRAAEARIAEIARSLRESPPQRVDAAVAARHRAYKQIVDRRTFSWTGLLAALEETLPGDVRLVRIVPGFEGADVTVDLSAEARSREAAFELAETLERSSAFARTRILRVSEGESGVTFDVTVVLEPSAATRGPSPGHAP